MINKNKYMIMIMPIAGPVYANDGLSLEFFIYLFLYFGEIGVLLIAVVAVPLSLLVYLHRRFFLKKIDPRLDVKAPALYFSFTAVVPALLLLADTNALIIGMCLVHFTLLLISWLAYFWLKPKAA